MTRTQSRSRSTSGIFLLLLFSALAVLGCLPPRLTALRSEVEAAGVARITLHGRSDSTAHVVDLS
jgi:hypothetical protein